MKKLYFRGKGTKAWRKVVEKREDKKNERADKRNRAKPWRREWRRAKREAERDKPGAEKLRQEQRHSRHEVVSRAMRVASADQSGILSPQKSES